MKFTQSVRQHWKMLLKMRVLIIELSLVHEQALKGCNSILKSKKYLTITGIRWLKKRNQELQLYTVETVQQIVIFSEGIFLRKAGKLYLVNTILQKKHLIILTKIKMWRQINSLISNMHLESLMIGFIVSQLNDLFLVFEEKKITAINFDTFLTCAKLIFDSFIKTKVKKLPIL